MSTPKKRKRIDLDSTDRSPKHFRWTQLYEDTLLDLLLAEVRNGNRPEGSFTASAFRNVVKSFNRIHQTSIMKTNVQSRIKTMKHHFVIFHGAFNGLSGFAWNRETKMFEAEEDIWAERAKENPRLEKLRDKACHNWDKRFELFGDNRATGASAASMKEKARTIHRGLHFEEQHIQTDDIDSTAPGDAHECSSYGEHELSKNDAAPGLSPEHIQTPKSSGSSLSKLKRKSTLISVMQDGYKSMAESIDKLSMALASTGDKVAGSKVDVNLNCQIYEALAVLGLDEEYRVRYYFYLCENPSKAAILVAAPSGMRGKLLFDIMKSAGL